MRFRLAVCFLGFVTAALSADPRRVIVDTDVGSDDLMAIAFLLSRPDVAIEALTVANGLAHVDRGAANLTRLLELAGRRDIPVYAGSPDPLRTSAPFPEAWRKTADDLPGVELPRATRGPEPEKAAEYLEKRLRDTRRPVTILALGPLTNLAQAFRSKRASVKAIQEIVIMGGAVRVQGNLGDGGFFKTDNKSAEWNIFVDPLAADIVFRSGVKIRLIPLDATSKVPIFTSFLDDFRAQARTLLGKFVSQVLETDRPHIEGGYFFAWDPLAAVAMMQPDVVAIENMAIQIRQNPPEAGRTFESPALQKDVVVAVDASPARFRKAFFEAFAGAQ